MRLYERNRRNVSPRHRRIWAAYELAHTIADFGAAISFLVGSVLFFWTATQYAATWLFVFGSLLFVAKPTIRLVRELRLLAEGDIDDLAERAEE